MAFSLNNSPRGKKKRGQKERERGGKERKNAKNGPLVYAFLISSPDTGGTILALHLYAEGRNREGGERE